MRALVVDDEAELRETLADTDPLASCRDFALKKLRQYEPIDDPANRRKLVDLLRRRGFEVRTIYSALGALATPIADEETDSDE